MSVWTCSWVRCANKLDISSSNCKLVQLPRASQQQKMSKEQIFRKIENCMEDHSSHHEKLQSTTPRLEPRLRCSTASTQDWLICVLCFINQAMWCRQRRAPPCGWGTSRQAAAANERCAATKMPAIEAPSRWNHRAWTSPGKQTVCTCKLPCAVNAFECLWLVLPCNKSTLSLDHPCHPYRAKTMT